MSDLTRDKLIEAMARQMAIDRGVDPDDEGSGTVPGWRGWMVFALGAGRVLNAIGALAAVVPREATAHALAASIMHSTNDAIGSDKVVAAEAVLLCTGSLDIPTEGRMVEPAAILAQDYRLMVAVADLSRPAVSESEISHDGR